MKLSIVVPVYNMAADGKLRYCLDSLINQTVSDYEIIAVDDASTDESLDILMEYERKYPDKLRVIQSAENLRQGGARNKGIDAARGKWLGFIDSDDWAAPDMYEKLIKKAEQTGADVAGCDYSLVNEHSMRVGRIVTTNTEEQTGILDRKRHGLLIMNPSSMVIKIYLKSVIDKYHLRFPEKTFYEDNCASPLWLMRFEHFERVSEPLYYYYQHDASTVHGISVEKCEARLNMGQNLIDESKSAGFYDEYRPQLEFAFSKIYYMNTLFTYMLGVKRPRLSFLRKIRAGMKREFPDFQANAYYQAEFDSEQKRMAAIHMKSPLAFLIYFKLLYFYRDIRKKLPNRLKAH